MKRFHSTAVLLFSLICHTFASDLKPYVIAESEGIRIHQYASEVLRIAYERANIPLEIRIIPGQRALTLVNSGHLDGDVARIEAITETYPNLVIVPTPVAHFTAYAYGIDSTIQVNSWQDLKNHRVAIVRGVQYSKNGTEGMTRDFFNSYEKMLEMVVMGRVDVLIAGEFEVNQTIATKYAGKGIQPLGNGLFHSPLYHVLHKSHADLVLKIDKELLTMQHSGELEKLSAQFLHSSQ